MRRRWINKKELPSSFSLDPCTTPGAVLEQPINCDVIGNMTELWLDSPTLRKAYQFGCAVNGTINVRSCRRVEGH